MSRTAAQLKCIVGTATKIAVIGVLALCSLCAEEPSVQYSVGTWGHKDGLPSTFIYSIAQTADGFLWLGTDDGLVRFDGMQFTRWRPALPNGDLPGQVRVLQVSSHGELLLGTGSGLVGVMRGDGVEATQLDSAVDSIQDASDGSVWVATTTSIWHLAPASMEPTEPPIRLPAGWLSGPLQSSDGREWIGTEGGLFYVDRGRLMQAAPKRAWLLIGPSGHPAWLDDKGSFHLLGTRGVSAGIRGLSAYTPEIRTVIADDNGCLWIGTAGQGILRRSMDGHTPVQHYTRNDGLSSDFIRSIFEDREHNIWVATENGLDRLRRDRVLSLTRSDGLISNRVTSIAAGNDGSVWLGTTDGLQRLIGGKSTTYLSGGRIVSLLIGNDQQLWAGTATGLVRWKAGREMPVGRNAGFTAVTALAQDESRTLWFVDAEKGIFREAGGDDPIAITNPALLHRHVTSMASSGDAVWFGLGNGGIVEERQGSFRTYSAGDGLSGGAVHGMFVSSDGELWLSTDRGLCFLENDRFYCRNSASGLPGNRVLWALPDAHGNLWLGYNIGLARVSAQALRHSVAENVSKVDFRFFDDADGIVNSPDLNGNAPASFAKDGRLWLTTSQGVAVLDPEQLHTNVLPPPVHILGIEADGKAVALNAPIRLAPLTRSLQFSFTGLSLVVPRKVRFRYQLEGFDRQWRDGGSSREASYTNLSPGQYTFRVRAANNDGVWNNTGAELSFDLAPAWYQTLWFQLLCIAAILLALAFLVRLRLRSAQRMMRLRFEERMEERTRIAQDLHDHLVQEMVGISMQLEVADELTPGSAEAKTPLLRALMLARSAISSGRQTLQSLRQRPVTGSALLDALRRTADAYPERNGVTVEYSIEADERLFRPEVAEELCDLGQEALRNALTHAGKGTIHVRLLYSSSSFELQVRDEGQGISESVQRAGVSGHYGLAGMRERAVRIGGDLRIMSAPGQGTWVRVVVPAARAYQDSDEPRNRDGRRRRKGAQGATR